LLGLGLGLEVPEGRIDGVGGRCGVVKRTGPPQPVHQVDRIGDIQTRVAGRPTAAGVELALLLGGINRLPVTLHLGLPS
jgi:hypothetical protein